jgi:hypothetical protein
MFISNKKYVAEMGSAVLKLLKMHSLLRGEVHMFLYLLLTAIGLMSGGCVYKDHTFNKETAHTSYNFESLCSSKTLYFLNI